MKRKRSIVDKNYTDVTVLPPQNIIKKTKQNKQKTHWQ